jgi:lysophospholipase L1-like esterase
LRRCLKVFAGGLAAVVTMIPVGESLEHLRWHQDPDLGGVFNPGSRVVWRTEGNGTSHWTEHGIRGRGLPDTNAFLVLALGDSFTEALQVNDDKVYTSLLERELRQRGIPAVVLNAGKSGASAADHIWRARLFKRLLHPSWFIVQVEDADFTSKGWDASRGNSYFRRNGTHDGVEVAPPPPNPEARTAKLLGKLPGWFSERLTFAYPIRRTQEFQAWLKNEPPWFHAPPMDGAKSALDAPSTAQYPIGAELDLLKEACGGHLTLLLLTSYRLGGGCELNAAEQAIAGLARAKGISCTRLDQGFGMISSPRRSPYGFDNLLGFNRGHLNPEGHRIAAAVLSRELAALSSVHALQ